MAPEKPLVDLYLRKSQVIREGDYRRELSMDAQEERGRKWADTENFEIRKIWRENQSAYRSKTRPKFESAVSALLEDESQALWVFDSSRYSRRGAGDVLRVMDEGKRIVFDYDRLDSAEPRDRKYIINKAEDAKEYSDLLSYKVTGTKAVQREMGMWLSAAPDGLRVDPKTRKLHHTKRWPIYERIFAEAAKGRPHRKIAMALTADRIAAPRGDAWLGSTIGTILRNPVYLGWQTIRVNGRHEIWRNPKGEKVSVFAEGVEPIPQATWDKARRMAAGHQRPEISEDEQPAAPNPLAGSVRCEGCKGNSTSVGTSFRCSRHIAGGPCPAPVSILRDSVIKYVWAEWKKRVAAKDPMDPTMVAVAEGWVTLSQPEESNAEREARATLKGAEEGVKRLDRVFAAGAYDGAEGELTFARLRREAVTAVAEAKKTWETIAQPVADLSVLTNPTAAQELWERSDDHFRGQLIRLAIKAVHLRQADYSGQRTTGRIRIEWAKPQAWEEEQEKPAKAA
ncbi:recombinase family protein [Kitasatospora sp. NBC_01287]|uniref:recombinase family protein n=1 Tax=Kitasatospora sp. NBC_01287 TaxID=2903573 RepID=UPI00225006BB|nr:recombinase family protein [Kitasatospora sp. NBC_01287]MCX4751411.1 recombinase family protein [Kitasatospora sp. NBC_01287]